jgi:hypothetical protein
MGFIEATALAVIGIGILTWLMFRKKAMEEIKRSV